jgi:hypothetical protein
MTRAQWQHTGAWLSLILLGVGIATLRFQVIESPAITHLCNAGPAPFWCGGVQFVIAGFVSGGFGYAALAAAALALLWRHVLSAWLATALGLVALNLYCYEAGALAVLIGCLCLLRVQVVRRKMTQAHPA